MLKKINTFVPDIMKLNLIIMRYLILKTSALGVISMLILFSCGNKDKITLQYNFQQGETLRQNKVTNIDLVQKITGQEMKISLATEMKTVFDVKENRNDSYTLEVKYRELKMETGIPGMDAGKITFDSNTAEDVATQINLGPMFKAVVNKPFEIVVNKTGKIESVKGLDIFHETMLNAFDEGVPEDVREQMVVQFGSQFSEEVFKSQFEQNTGYFPDKPVGAGDSWNSQMATTVSNFTINVNTKSTLKSIEGNVVNLNVEGTVSIPEGYEQEINGVKGKVSFTGTQRGTVKLNKDTGWVIFSDIMMNFNGEVEAMGMKVPVYVATKITVTDR
jgi:hypothetical protein